MDPTKTATNIWIPVCCERVMRFNMFVQKNGTVYGSLVCTVCNKNVAYELEHNPDISGYGDGAKLVTMLASPKPPKNERKRIDEDAATNDLTL